MKLAQLVETTERSQHGKPTQSVGVDFETAEQQLRSQFPADGNTLILDGISIVDPRSGVNADTSVAVTIKPQQAPTLGGGFEDEPDWDVVAWVSCKDEDAADCEVVVGPIDNLSDDAIAQITKAIEYAKHSSM